MIIPCVCIDHRPTVMDSVLYGMPQIDVANTIKGYKQQYSVFCPNCGRGLRLPRYNTVDSAIRDWNAIQRRLWTQALYLGPGSKPNVPQWRFDYWNDIKKSWGRDRLPYMSEEKEKRNDTV